MSPLIDVYTMRSGFSPCVYADASPGVESLVGRELTQSLGARLLVSALHAVGAIFNLFYICFTLDNQMKVRIVLFSSTVIFTAVSFDVFNSHYIILVSVYRYM